MKIPFLLGRIIFGGFFLYNGINHFRNREAMAQYAGAKQIPLPEIAVQATGALMLLGGASLVLGIKPKFGAAAIAGFLLAVSPMMHDFWKVEDANQRSAEMANFTKNIALAGAAVALLAVEEPWPISVPLSQPTVLERVRNFARSKVAA